MCFPILNYFRVWEILFESDKVCFSPLELTFKMLGKGNKLNEKEKEQKSLSLGVVGQVPGGHGGHSC